MRFKHFSFLLFVLFCSLQYESQAQWTRNKSFNSYGYRNMINGDVVQVLRKKPFSRFGIGLTYAPFSSTFEYQYEDDLGVADSLTSIDSKGMGYGLALSMSIPFAAPGLKSLVAFSVGIHVNGYVVEADPLTINVERENYHATSEYSGGGGAVLIGVPVGFELISGGEASLDRADAFSFNVGAGFMPSMAVGGMYDFVGAKFHAPFYAKAELGFHLGINWKIRGTYLASSPTSFNNMLSDMDLSFGELKTRMKNKDQFMISLIVQPFSFTWD